jgi:hypothetical protein
VFFGRLDRVLTALAASGLIILGIGEVLTRLNEPMPLLYWLPTLWGGAALILIGGIVGTDSTRLSKTLVVAGCAIGFMPSVWTLVMPALLITLIIRTLGTATPRSELPGEM